MKNSLFPIVLLLLVVNYLPLLSFDISPWQRLDADLTKVRYDSTNMATYVLGSNGCLLRSADLGITWKQPFTGTFKSLLSIGFATHSIGIIVGDSGTILRSSDEGNHWEDVQSSVYEPLTTVTFTSSTDGFIGGLNGTLLKTVDAGRTWHKMDFPFSFHLRAIIMDSPFEGIIIGGNSSLLRTTDGGVTWGPQKIVNMPAGNYEFYGFVQVSKKKYFYGNNPGSSSGVIVTTNDGIIFTALSIPFTSDIDIKNDSIYLISTENGITKAQLSEQIFTPVPLFDTTYSVSTVAFNKYSLCFINDTVAIAVGENKFMYRSNDGMNTWSLVSYLYNTNSYETIKFLNDTSGFLCGNSKHVFRTNNSGATWLPEKAASVVMQTPISIDFISNNQGFVLCNNGKNTVVETKDIGQTFTAKFTYMQVGSDVKMKFMDSLYGLTFGSYSNYSKSIVNTTSDGGQSWQRKDFDNYFTNMAFGGSTMIILSGPRTIFSRDRGNTWDSVSFPYDFTSLGCWALDSLNLLVTGSINTPKAHGIIVRSSDAGKTWKTIDTSEEFSTFKISFSTPSLGYILSRRLLRTIDGGYTWKSVADKSPVENTILSKMEALPDGNIILSVFEPNNAIPHNTILLRSYFDKSTVLVDEPTTKVADLATVWLYAPRPIPSTGKIHLNALWLKSLDPSTIAIKLYDMLGFELKNISDAFHPNNSTNSGFVEFDGSSLTSGIYYIEISGGGYRKAVPVIIAR